MRDYRYYSRPSASLNGDRTLPRSPSLLRRNSSTGLLSGHPERPSHHHSHSMEAKAAAAAGDRDGDVEVARSGTKGEYASKSQQGF